MKKSTRRINPISTKKPMHIPSLNFGERQALRRYAKEAGMSPEEMVRECISEMAYQIAMCARWDNELRTDGRAGLSSRGRSGVGVDGMTRGNNRSVVARIKES